MIRAKSVRYQSVLAVVVAMSLGCSEKIVYRDLPDFEAPPTGALGFLGYSNSTTKQTTCGNCHSGKQATWAGTEHSNAWADLQADPTKDATCDVCHSVTSNGNSSSDPTAGYMSTQNARYQDVQCESCHGPGLTHATNPDITGSQPLASIVVAPGLDNGCGECHSGAHQPFVEQWATSGHGDAPGSRGTRDSCWSCHEARHVLEAWGINTNYKEFGTTTDTVAIVCSVCHDPHSRKNEHQLRFSISTPDLETNLCMKCHYRRANPQVTSSSGPHSPQGPTLLGEAGWFPPNFVYPPKSLVGSHGSDRNPDLCAGCHVNAYTEGSFTATGHSFKAIPCVDSQGIPTAEQPDRNTYTETCPEPGSQQSYKACVTCHLTETAARTARTSAHLSLDFLASQVEALLPLIPSTEFSTTDNRISTAEGSKFNAQLARQPGTAIHNPFLAEALLIASLQQIKIDYGLPSVGSLDLRPRLTPPPSLKVLTGKAK